MKLYFWSIFELHNELEYIAQNQICTNDGVCKVTGPKTCDLVISIASFCMANT